MTYVHNHNTILTQPAFPTFPGATLAPPVFCSLTNAGYDAAGHPWPFFPDKLCMTWIIRVALNLVVAGDVSLPSLKRAAVMGVGALASGNQPLVRAFCRLFKKTGSLGAGGQVQGMSRFSALRLCCSIVSALFGGRGIESIKEVCHKVFSSSRTRLRFLFCHCLRPL